MGVTPEAVVYRDLLPLMNATKIKFLKNDTEFVELADNATRVKALHIAYAPKEPVTQQAAMLRAIILVGPRPPCIPRIEERRLEVKDTARYEYRWVFSALTDQANPLSIFAA